MRDRPSSLSFVIACFNEEEVLPILCNTIKKVASSLNIPYETILVDDGSTDATWKQLKALSKKDPHLRAIKLSRNFGQQAALTCGIDSAKGEVVIVMDADLQDPPELAKDMIDKWQEGFDVVYAQRIEREGEGTLKRFLAFCFYRLFINVLKVPIPQDTGDFRLMDKKVVKALRGMREKHRLIRALVPWVGFKQTAVKFKRPPRAAGDTKYPVWKSLALAIDAITSFSTFPVRLVFFVGCFLLIAAILALAVSAFFTSPSSNPAPLVISVCALLTALQLIALGIVGEYVGKIFEEVKRRPLYFVAEEIGSSETAFSSPL